jgi:hypothetical protein
MKIGGLGGGPSHPLNRSRFTAAINTSTPRERVGARLKPRIPGWRLTGNCTIHLDHGGLDRWNKVKAINVAASISGAIWYVKSKGDFLKIVVLTAETRNERVTVDFPGQDKRAIFEPNRIVIETADGTLTEARDNPEESFEGQQRETPWNDIHVVYFVGEALWTYLNTPFLYTYEGFTTEETPSIQVEDETCGG